MPQPLVVQETQLLVLAGGDARSAANERGDLFEHFVARVLERFGYGAPQVDNMKVTEGGIEFDVVAHHRLTGRRALAECKAYSAPVAQKELSAFFGKLNEQRLTSSEEIDGFFFALPHLTQPGAEVARRIHAVDPAFRYLNSDAIAAVLRDLGLVAEIPFARRDDKLLSDPAIAITPHGICSVCKVLDERTRRPARVIAWTVEGDVPEVALQLIRESDYAGGISVSDARGGSDDGRPVAAPSAPILVEVRGGESDFDYQLPASPRYFVGRTKVLADLEALISQGSRLVVVNAQSGWGKSSLALRLKQSAQRLRGHAAIFDSRTASDPSYVVAALRSAALGAEKARILDLPETTSWGSLSSAVQTLATAVWKDGAGPLLVFFDQFENVFADETLTREFRNLALAVQHAELALVVGFAWKTDLVGWTEGHPYRLRDEIRSRAHVELLLPFGPSEIDTLLRRLDKNLGVKLAPELRERLREYSQGLPWLFKKLAGHVLRQVAEGTSQAELVSEALNVQNLFEEDLSELQPREHEGLLHIARFAPVPVSEAMERVPAAVVQSLLDRRLIVQVGERLDTYWDTFRDFLLTGRIPIQDSYILRTTPTRVGRMLKTVVELGGDVAVSVLAERLGTTEKVVYILCREPRLFGALAHEPNRIRLIDEVRTSDNKETEIRRRVVTSLRRHKAYSLLTRLAERRDGPVPVTAFARVLPGAFPAVAASEKSWTEYARAFAQWFQYAGLVTLSDQSMAVVESQDVQEIGLFSYNPGGSRRSVLRSGSSFPSGTPGRALNILARLAAGQVIQPGLGDGKAVRDLVTLGAVKLDRNGMLSIKSPSLFAADGGLEVSGLLQLLVGVPGGADALELLRNRPAASLSSVGRLLREAYGASWADSTTALMGKYFRSWARAAGVELARAAAESNGSLR